MRHDDAFLQAILAAPEDDGPRLIYADWLEEHGALDRAAFIRLQCEAALLPLADPRREELAARAWALLTDENWSAWGGMLRGMVHSWQFRRGFVEKTWMGVQSFLQDAERVMRLAPVRHIKLIGTAPVTLSALASPWLDRLITLDLREAYLSQEDERVLRARFGARVRR